MRAVNASGRDVSPTPNRRVEALLVGSSQLTQNVFKLLQSNSLLLKSSAQIELRNLIDSEIRILEAKVKGLESSFSALGDQLDQLEIEDR